MDELVVCGLYSVKNKYFQDFKRPHWVDNKNEKRPYYYLIKDKDGIDWLIPMSSQVENYRAKIKKVEAKRGEGNCVYYHIGKVASKESVFLIGDMFPVDESYVKAPFTIDSVHYIVKNDKLNATLYSKAMRYLHLVFDGKMHSRNDIIGIKRILLSRRQNKEYIV